MSAAETVDAYDCAQQCGTQSSTEQFWWCSLFFSRQSSQFRCSGL